MREEGANHKPHAMEASSRREEVARQVGDWPWCTRFEHKIMEIHAAKKIYAKNLLKEAVVEVRLGEEWPDESPHKGRVGFVAKTKNRTCNCQA